MVDKHDALGSKSTAFTGQAEGHCHPFTSDTPISRPDTLCAPFNPFPDQVHLPSSHVSDVGSSCIASSSLTYERASGESRSVDAIALALSRQHLHNDTQNSLAEIPASISANPLATPSPTAGIAPKASPPHQYTPTASSLSASRPHTVTLELPDPLSYSPSQQDTQDADKHYSVRTNDSTQLWQRILFKYPKVLDKNEATQTLLESMICSETQCNVQTSLLPTPSTREQEGPCRTGSETTLMVDEIMTDNISLEEPLLDKILSARCGMKPAGISKSSLPGYRSSTETALRCRNLVRSKPRMRKRTKLREKSSSSSMPSATRPTVASAATAS